MEDISINHYSDEEKLLIERMKVRAPTLVLGAGFSYGIKNGRGKDVPIGKELSALLFDKVLAKALKNDLEYLEKYREDKNDLKKTCENILAEKLVKERNLVFKESFSGCHCSDDDYHMLLKQYPWRNIYTLNIDDLLDFIYRDVPEKQKPNVHIMQNSSVDVDAPLNIYMLHGYVKREDIGYVFDSAEYNNFIVQSSMALSTFGYHYMSGDVVFLGTEFQEEDLNIIISKWESKADSLNPPHYFFVSPELHSLPLRRKIEKNENLHYIQWTTKKFLTSIDKEIHIIDEGRRRLRDYGMVFYNEQFQKIERNVVNSIPDIYFGEAPRPADFFNEFDFLRPGMIERADRIVSSNLDYIVAIYGDSYVGKTCSALRLGVELMKRGYEFCVYSLSFGTEMSVYMRHVLDYLELLPEGTNVAILAENMPYGYKHVARILEKRSKKIGSLVFICTGDSNDHYAKKYFLEQAVNSKVCLEEVLITEKTNNYEFARSIYQKLESTNHLNKLRSYGENERSIIKYIQEVNDVIDVLYIAHQGRRFEEYFIDKVQKIEDDQGKDYSSAFLLMCAYASLGIHEMPKSFFVSITSQCTNGFDYSEFKKRYIDFLRFDERNIRLRCSRTLRTVMKGKLTKEDVMFWIQTAVCNLGENIGEREASIRSELFQKLLKVKSIRNKLPLNYSDIQELLMRVQGNCKHLSYYWVQSGIAHREMQMFEEADNAFSEADAIRNNTSNHIKHARAKNYMTWGLWAIEHEPTRSQYYFDMGRDLIEDILNNNDNSFYSYSAHTFIDMMIRYHQGIAEPISSSDLIYIINLLLRWPDIQIDYLAPEVEGRFLKYCNSIDYDVPLINQLRIKYDNTFSRSRTGILQQFDSDDIEDFEFVGPGT